MNLKSLFAGLADVFDAPEPIEISARSALIAASEEAGFTGQVIALQQPFLDVLQHPEAHPVCKLIPQARLPWAPPESSTSELYKQDSWCKAHVEILGPDGLVKSDRVRIGLYGMLPDAAYGIRTHPAEEIYIMLAGEAVWKRGGNDYSLAVAGERSYHPSMMEHATKTGSIAFMSIYAWAGDLSTENYQYSGKT